MTLLVLRRVSLVLATTLVACGTAPIDPDAAASGDTTAVADASSTGGGTVGSASTTSTSAGASSAGGDGATSSDDTAADASGSDDGEPDDPNCPAAAVFCESFEDGDALDPSRWEPSGAEGAVSIDTTQAYDGGHSLHVRMGAEYGLDGAAAAKLLVGVPAPDDRIHARWYMRMGDMSLPGYHPNLVLVTGPDYDIGHWWDFATISFGTFLGEFSVNAFGLGLDGAKLWTERGNEVLPDFGGDTTPRSEHGIASGEWFCVEWTLDGDHQGADDMEHPGEREEVAIEGNPVPDLLGTDETWAPFNPPEHWSPIYDGSIWTFGIGGAYPQGPTLDVWFDAIVFSHEPVGC